MFLIFSFQCWVRFWLFFTVQIRVQQHRSKESIWPSKIFLAGDTRTVLSKENIRNAFNCDAAIIEEYGIILQPLPRSVSV